jgi:hypothetical protein
MKTIDIFKNVLRKKGVENLHLSNDSNKGISNFRETIPLRTAKDALASCTYLSRSHRWASLIETKTPLIVALQASYNISR